MAKKKILRSHMERVKWAKEIWSKMGERGSIFDREALVEYGLLLDIEELYKKRLREEEEYEAQSRVDRMGKRQNLNRFNAFVNIFEAAVSAARAAIKAGNYKMVRKAIHERKLMAAANSTKRLSEMGEMAIELLRALSADSLFAEKVDKEINEGLDDLEIHEKNVRDMQGIPQYSPEDIESIISAVEAVIQADGSEKKKKRNIV